MGSTMTTTTIDLDKLDTTIAFLADAADFLLYGDHDNAGFGYILEKIGQDLEAIQDPVRRLISECHRGRRKSKSRRRDPGCLRREASGL
jgi:hypothetical protein